MRGKVGRREQFSVDGVHAEVTYKRIRRMYLRIRSSERLVQISAPYSYQREVIVAFIQAQLPWIRKQQERHRIDGALPTYADGEVMWLWGRRYTLERRPQPGPHVTLTEKTIQLHVPLDIKPDVCRSILGFWYGGLLKTALEPLMVQWVAKLNVPMPHVRIRRMSSRWGSCSLKTRSLSINLELVRYAPECLEYIVVHELAHFFVQGHNAQFYAILDRYLPHWREARRQLKP